LGPLSGRHQTTLQTLFKVYFKKGKNIMKRFLWLGLVIMLMALAACGGSQTEPVVEEPAAEVPVAEEAVEEEAAAEEETAAEEEAAAEEERLVVFLA
jgi:predicted small lipoprotein YifL